MTFWDIATSNLTWILVGLGLLYVFALAGVFVVKSWKRCIQLGVDGSVVKKVLISSATFSIVPSLSIVIGLIGLAALIGTPWAWFRLSVVGALPYELMAADMAGKALGAESLAVMKGEPAMVMGAVMIVMSLGIISSNVFNVFFAKKISGSISSYNEKSGGWGALFTSCFLVTMISIMAVVQLLSGTIHALTLCTSIVSALLIGYLAKKFKIGWMSDFVMVLTMLIGMVSSVLWTSILG